MPDRLFVGAIAVAMALGSVRAAPAAAQDAVAARALAHSVEQLRSSIGEWSVETRFLNDDGSTSSSVMGTYAFEWVVPDRVVMGKSEIPELGQASGLLFYVNEAEGEIEMVSVGADGRLWIMDGPLGGEVRQSQEYATANGGTARLRFTRLNVSGDAFESRMEYTEDGGRTWKPGNHQLFNRVRSTSSR